MKDVYKIKAGDLINSIQHKTQTVHEMLNGQRPANTQLADQYLHEIKRGLETLQEIVDIS